MSSVKQKTVIISQMKKKGEETSQLFRGTTHPPPGPSLPLYLP